MAFLMSEAFSVNTVLAGEWVGAGVSAAGLGVPMKRKMARRLVTPGDRRKGKNFMGLVVGRDVR